MLTKKLSESHNYLNLYQRHPVRRTLMRPTCVLIACTFLFCACGWISYASAVDEIIQFPISQFEGDIITLPVTIDGNNHLFVLDSGASWHSFDLELKPHLGASSEVTFNQADGSKTRAKKFDPPEARVGHYSMGIEAPVICTDLSTMRESTGRNIKGILGMPFFAAHVIQLDFDKNVLRIMPGVTEPHAEWGQPIPVSFTEPNKPVISGKIAGYSESKEENFLIDSGFNRSISLRSELFEYLAHVGAITQLRNSKAAFVNKSVQSSCGRLQLLELVGYDHKDLNVFSGYSISKLGNDFLRRFLVTFDLGRSRIFLKPNVNFHQADSQRSLGIFVMRKVGQTIVTDVYAKEPAELAGVQVDDVILSVGGVPITNQPLAEVYSLFRVEADSSGKLLLLVERDGQVKSLLARLSNGVNK